MVSSAVPELAWSLESPLNVACNVTWPIIAAVIHTEQVPLERVHLVLARKTEPVPLCDQLTVPFGE